ncbi:hypothetical protein Tco_0371487 [Tanacetum coccineum]
MGDPNITMEEYIRLEEEKARKHGKVFNWETTKYGKIWYDEEVHDLRSVETEFPAIVFNDNLTSNKTLSYEPTVSSLNDNEIDFRISFDESDNEDYTIVFDKNSFSYKIISTNDFKKDSENDNEIVNMPLFPSPEPSVSCIDDLDFFKDFENEFPAIVYNDALTSKSDFSTEPTLYPQHIDEFDLKDETSLSEYDKVEQNVLYFNDLFPFNIIYPNDLKSNKDNDDNEIDMIQSSGDIAVPPGDHRHQYLRFEGLQYTEGDIADYETRDRVYSLAKLRGDYLILEANVHELILEFFSTFRFGEAVLDLDLSGALQFQLGKVRRRMSWREFILALGLHTAEEMQTAGFGLYWAMSTMYLRFFTSGRKQGAMISGGQFLAHLAEYFRLLLFLRLSSEESAALGLTICIELDDTWTWVALGPERQPDVVVGAPEAAEDAFVADEGTLSAVPHPSQVPSSATELAAGHRRLWPQRLARVEEDVQEIRGALAILDKQRLADLAEKEIDNVGEVSTIWKSGSVGVLKLQDGCSTHNLAYKLNMENLPNLVVEMCMLAASMIEYSSRPSN